MLYSHFCTWCNWWALIRTSYCWVSPLTRTVVLISIVSPQTPGGTAWLKRNTSVPRRYRAGGWPNWGCVWEKKHSQYKWSHFRYLFRREGTYLSPKMKKKKKRTHGKYMACQEDGALCISPVTTSILFNAPLTRNKGRQIRTTWANQTQSKNIKVHKWNATLNVARYSNKIFTATCTPNQNCTMVVLLIRHQT